MRKIDFRSDTLTTPTEAMRKAMYEAEVGDDVYGEDPTVNRLEEAAAEFFGKEAALFVTSGTQGNQLAVLCHTRPGDEVIVEAESHIYLYETAGMAALAGVQAKTITGTAGQMATDAIARAVRPADIHQPRTALICLENTHNKAGGRILPFSYMEQVRSFADEVGIPVHLDGARLFNAIVASGIAATEWAAQVDSLQVCLSKGLSAPVGSLLVGSRDFIDRARYYRKRLGGGMRQAGVIAAPGLVALTTMVERLAEDHDNAKHLAAGLAHINGLTIDPATVDTNILLVDIRATGLTNEAFVERLKGENVLCSGFGDGIIRFVTHREITRADVEEALRRISTAVTGAIR